MSFFQPFSDKDEKTSSTDRLAQPPTTPEDRLEERLAQNEFLIAPEREAFLFFQRNHQLWRYALSTSEQQVLTNVPNDSKLFDLHRLNNEAIIYSQCSQSSNDCSIQQTDFQGNTESLQTFSTDQQLLQLAVDTPERMAWLVETQPEGDGTIDREWSLQLWEDREIQTLYQTTGTPPFGRARVLEDHEQLTFSPRGAHLLHVQTESIRQPFDYIVYVFSLYNDRTQIIENATMPIWLSQDSIIFRQTDTDQIKLWYQDNQFIQALNLQGYAPQLYPASNQLLFWDWTDQAEIIWYDVKNETRAILPNPGLNPAWVDQDHIVYQTLFPCPDPCEIPPTVRGTQELRLYNWSTQVEITLPFTQNEWLPLQ